MDILFFHHQSAEFKVASGEFRFIALKYLVFCLKSGHLHMLKYIHTYTQHKNIDRLIFVSLTLFLLSTSWKIPVFGAPTSHFQRHSQQLALHQHRLLTVLSKMMQSLRALNARSLSSMLSWIYSGMLGR